MKNIDYLFVGSSMFRRGLSVNVLEENLGERVFILAYRGYQPVTMEEGIKYLLKNDVKIRNLLVDMYSYSLVVFPSISDKRLLWDMDFATKRSVYDRIMKANPMSWLERYNYFIRANNEYMLTYPVSSKLIRERYYKGGAVEFVQGMDPDNLPVMEGGFLKLPSEINQYQKEAIINLINIAEKNSIKLLFVETPKYIDVANNAKYKTIMKKYANILNEQEATYILASEVDFNNSNSGYFNDFIHLSGAGQLLYTKNLCKYLSIGNNFK